MNNLQVERILKVELAMSKKFVESKYFIRVKDAVAVTPANLTNRDTVNLPLRGFV